MAKRPEMYAKLQELAARSDALGTTIPWDRLTVNRWQPDTCGCTIDFYFDDDDPTTVEFADTVVACPAHAATVTNPTTDLVEGRKVHDAAHSENRRKNRSLAVVASELGLDLSDPADQEAVYGRFTFALETTVLADGVSRVMTVTVTGINNNQRDVIQSYADAEFGAGAILIVRG